MEARHGVYKNKSNFKENKESYNDSKVLSESCRKTTEEEMDMLRFKETIDQLTIANKVRWYGYVLGRDNNSVLRVAPDLQVSGERKQDD